MRQSFGNCPQYIQRRAVHSEPRAPLLFIDFESGDLLQLQGVVQIDWSEEAAQRFEGAERLWHFQVVRGWRRRNASPLHWSFVWGESVGG